MPNLYYLHSMTKSLKDAKKPFNVLGLERSTDYDIRGVIFARNVFMNMEAFIVHKDVQCTLLCALMYHHKSCQFHSMTLDNLDEYLVEEHSCRTFTTLN